MPTKTMPDLSGFIGSERLFQHWVPHLRYTEGIQHLAEEVGGYWFIDVVASHIAANRRVQAESFQIWSLKLNGKGGCTVTMRPDTGEKPIVRQRVEYTDFPEDFECYCCAQGSRFVLMLKSERRTHGC